MEGWMDGWMDGRPAYRQVTRSIPGAAVVYSVKYNSCVADIVSSRDLLIKID